MKTLGIILIVAGVIMMLINGFNVPIKSNVVTVGPVQVSRTVKKWVGWPMYAGGVLAAIGLVLVVADKKRS